ncbi:MAG: hypothetical protein PVG92_06590, partial [Holophagae bacterium]
MQPQVIMTRVDRPVFEQAEDALRSSSVDLHLAPWNDETLEMVQNSRFDVIIIGFPGTITPLRRFVRCVRASGSACQRSGVILLSEPDH